MSTVEGTGYCTRCKQQRLTHRKGTNHVLHLILTLVTLGLWGIVWAIVALSNRSNAPRCSVCGAATAPLSWDPERQRAAQERTALSGGVEHPS